LIHKELFSFSGRRCGEEKCDFLQSSIFLPLQFFRRKLQQGKDLGDEFG
jgi:hypothetical protein